MNENISNNDGSVNVTGVNMGSNNEVAEISVPIITPEAKVKGKPGRKRKELVTASFVNGNLRFRGKPKAGEMVEKRTISRDDWERLRVENAAASAARKATRLELKASRAAAREAARAAKAAATPAVPVEVAATVEVQTVS